MAVEQSAENPLDIHFSQQTLVISPDLIDTLMIVADFSKSAKSRSFSTQLSDITVYDVADSIKLLLKNADGTDFLGSTGSFAKRIQITPSDPERSFFVYPNPFGRPEGDNGDTEAYFHFYLEQTSDVKVQVFTLLGELVYTDSRPGLGKGNHRKDLHWDGRNDNGKRVLNGVYIAAIEIKPTNGGKVERFITKIAYIK